MFSNTTATNIESSAKAIIQSVLGQVVSFTYWTLGVVTRDLLTLLQPLSALIFLIGLVLWITGVERRTGRRLMLGGIVIGVISLIG